MPAGRRKRPASAPRPPIVRRVLAVSDRERRASAGRAGGELRHARGRRRRHLPGRAPRDRQFHRRGQRRPGARLPGAGRRRPQPGERLRAQHRLEPEPTDDLGSWWDTNAPTVDFFPFDVGGDDTVRAAPVMSDGSVGRLVTGSGWTPTSCSSITGPDFGQAVRGLSFRASDLRKADGSGGGRDLRSGDRGRAQTGDQRSKSELHEGGGGPNPERAEGAVRVTVLQAPGRWLTCARAPRRRSRPPPSQGPSMTDSACSEGRGDG